LGKRSSGAVPFSTMIAILLMWFGISFPLVCLGFYFGYRKHVKISNKEKTEN
jgi:transmembrane 9 superfamily protein 2/4